MVRPHNFITNKLICSLIAISVLNLSYATAPRTYANDIFGARPNSQPIGDDTTDSAKPRVRVAGIPVYLVDEDLNPPKPNKPVSSDSKTNKDPKGVGSKTYDKSPELQGAQSGNSGPSDTKDPSEAGGTPALQGAPSDKSGPSTNNDPHNGYPNTSEATSRDPNNADNLPLPESPPLADTVAKAKSIAENRAWSHYYLAQHYLFRFAWDLADVEFEQAILYGPHIKTFHRNYCLFCLLRLNLPKALAEFMLATGLGDPTEYTPFEKAELDARAARLHYRKALSYAMQNRWSSSISELKCALTYAPNNSAIKHSLAFAYASAGLVDLAEKEYAAGFNSEPNDAYAHADFAFLLSQEGKGKPALNQLSKAVELQPDAAALHVDLAWMAESQGDLEKASNELLAAVKLSPKHAVLWAHLGRLLAAQGEMDAAKDAYDEALALDPQQSDAKDGLAKIGQK